jgi:hypothetical protein
LVLRRSIAFRLPLSERIRRVYLFRHPDNISKKNACLSRLPALTSLQTSCVNILAHTGYIERLSLRSPRSLREKFAGLSRLSALTRFVAKFYADPAYQAGHCIEP